MEINKENVSEVLAAIIAFNPEVILVAANVIKNSPERMKRINVSTPHTLGGFKASYFVAHRIEAGPQEIFDAGMRAGREVQWLERHYDTIADKIDWKKPGKDNIALSVADVEACPECLFIKKHCHCSS